MSGARGATLVLALLALPAGTLGCGNEVKVESSGSGGSGGAAGGSGGTTGTAPQACTAVLADCNGDPADGCEADLQNDGAHCGSCAHDCQGSPCSEGVCAPEILASNLYFASRLALDASRLYWTSADGGIRAMPLAGGDPKKLADGQSDPWDIAVDGLAVYWTNSGSDQVVSLTLGAGLPKILADAGNPLHLVVRGDQLYFTDTYDKASNDEHVRRIPTTGGALVNVGATLGAWAVAASDSRAYWTDPASDTVWSAPATGGPAEALATGIVDPEDIEVDSEAVYVTGLEATYRIPLAGGAPEALVWGAGRGLAIDGERLYVGAADGRLLAVPKTGGAAAALAKADLPPSDIAVDGSFVYWVVRAQEGLLARTPK